MKPWDSTRSRCRVSTLQHVPLVTTFDGVPWPVPPVHEITQGLLHCTIICSFSVPPVSDWLLYTSFIIFLELTWIAANWLGHSRCFGYLGRGLGLADNSLTLSFFVVALYDQAFFKHWFTCVWRVKAANWHEARLCIYLHNEDELQLLLAKVI